ncbi:hypothetical protein MCBRY_001194 [Methylocystis bryophila]
MSMKPIALALALAVLSGGARSSGTPADQLIDAPVETVAPMRGLPDHHSLISAYYMAKVYDQSNYKIGEIKDMLVDENGNIKAVLLSVGTFLRVGEKIVAVPFDSIQASEDDGQWRLSANLSTQSLRDAPAYFYNHRTAQWQSRRLASD